MLHYTISVLNQVHRDARQNLFPQQQPKQSNAQQKNQELGQDETNTHT